MEETEQKKAVSRKNKSQLDFYRKSAFQTQDQNGYNSLKSKDLTRDSSLDQKRDFCNQSTLKRIKEKLTSRIYDDIKITQQAHQIMEQMLKREQIEKEKQLKLRVDYKEQLEKQLKALEANKTMKKEAVKVTDDEFGKQFEENANLLCAFPKILKPTESEVLMKRKQDQVLNFIELGKQTKEVSDLKNVVTKKEKEIDVANLRAYSKQEKRMLQERKQNSDRLNEMCILDWSLRMKANSKRARANQNIKSLEKQQQITQEDKEKLRKWKQNTAVYQDILKHIHEDKKNLESSSIYGLIPPPTNKINNLNDSKSVRSHSTLQSKQSTRTKSQVDKGFYAWKMDNELEKQANMIRNDYKNLKKESHSSTNVKGQLQVSAHQARIERAQEFLRSFYSRSQSRIKEKENTQQIKASEVLEEIEKIIDTEEAEQKQNAIKIPQIEKTDEEDEFMTLQLEETDSQKREEFKQHLQKLEQYWQQYDDYEKKEQKKIEEIQQYNNKIEKDLEIRAKAYQDRLEQTNKINQQMMQAREKKSKIEYQIKKQEYNIEYPKLDPNSIRGPSQQEKRYKQKMLGKQLDEQLEAIEQRKRQEKAKEREQDQKYIMQIQKEEFDQVMEQRKKKQMIAHRLLADWDINVNIKNMEKKIEMSPEKVYQNIIDEDTIKRSKSNPKEKSQNQVNIYQKLLDKVNDDIEKKSVYSTFRQPTESKKQLSREINSKATERPKQSVYQQNEGAKQTYTQRESEKEIFPWEKRESSVSQIQRLNKRK